jgi:hypothetical protein
LNLSLLAVIKVGVEGVGMHMRTTYRYGKLIIESQIIFTQNMEHRRAVNGWHVGMESILPADCTLAR